MKYGLKTRKKSVACANRKGKTKYDTKIKSKLNGLLCLD